MTPPEHQPREQEPHDGPRDGADARKPLPTLWEVPDPLWELIAKVLAVYDPPKKMGRPRIDSRRAFNGIIYRMRTGCQWNQLPARFGDDASVHRALVRWEKAGIFDILWALLLMRCEDLAGVDWHWQAADARLGKARGVAKKGQRRNASAPTPPTGPRRASRPACLSRAEADRLRSA